MRSSKHTTTKNVVNDAPPMVTSYAQNREDIIIDGFFDGKREGTYVDLGANHPVADSVTKFFYAKGWTGVNIEPNPQLAGLLKIDRPNDTIIMKGVAGETAELEFRIYGNTGLSTFSEDIKSESGNIYDFFKDNYTDVLTQVDTLENILDSVEGLGKIDFMKIDVEGLEYEAIKSNNWLKYHPELICIEANHEKEDWHVLLEEHGYKKFFNDGLNDYFADAASVRMQKFAFPESVLMRYPKVMPFIPHKDAFKVSEETFVSTREVERTSLRNDLKGAINVLNGTLNKIMFRRIVVYKRERLARRIKSSLSKGESGTLNSISYVTPKIVGLKIALVGFTLIMKVAFKLKAKMKGLSL